MRQSRLSASKLVTQIFLHQEGSEVAHDEGDYELQMSQVVEHLPNLGLIPSDEKKDHIFSFLCFSLYALFTSHFKSAHKSPVT